MKKKNLNKAVSIALAGLLLVNPISAFAANDDGQGDGVAGGEGYTPGIEDDYFEVVLPTSATKDKMLDFKIDPYGRFAGGNTALDEEIVPAQNAQWYVTDADKKAGKTWRESVRKVPATPDNYKPGATIYFCRVDYENIPMGRTEANGRNNASNFFGKVINVEPEVYELNGVTQEAKQFEFSDQSNWIVATNKSSIPVSIKLEATWPQHDGISIVQKRDVLKDVIENSDKTTSPAEPMIYMAVQMTEGYTVPIEGEEDTNPVGQNYMTVEGVVGQVLYLSDVSNSDEQPTYPDGRRWYNYIKTPNQVYNGGKDSKISKIVAEAKTDLKKQPYYLMQKKDTGKVYLKENISEYEKLDGYTYPTYGFRLVGAANKTTKWENVANPAIKLMWRIEKGDVTSESARPYFKLTDHKQDYMHDLDGVIDDRQYVDIVHGAGDFKTTKIEKVEWEMDGKWYDLLKLGQPSAPDHDEVNYLNYVTLQKVDDMTTRVRIREMALLNWHDHGYLKDQKDSVTLRIWLDNYEEYLQLTIVDHNADK